MPVKPYSRPLRPYWSRGLTTKSKHGVGRAVIGHVNKQIKEAKEAKVECIECVRCTVRYSREDVLRGALRLETMVCSRCYQEMQRLPYPVSCFGKPGYVKTEYNRKHIYGYNPNALECRKFCPDRVICRLVVMGSKPKTVK